MNKTFLTIVFITAAFASVSAQRNQTAAERHLKYQSYAGARYFERNDSNLKGDSSYLVFNSAEKFDRTFGAAAINGYNLFLPNNVFDSKLVIAMIKRGESIYEYNLKDVTLKKKKLFVRYDVSPKNGVVSRARDDGGYSYSTSYFLTVDKSDYSEITFIENGKNVGIVSLTAVLQTTPDARHFPGKTLTGTGNLEIGASESLISQFDDAATGYAAYCFSNKSAVGRAILTKCIKGQPCEFTGTVETGQCKTPSYLNQPSSSYRVVDVASVRFVPTNPITAKKGTIEYLVQTLAAAFESGRMGTLDAERPYLDTVQIIIEDSLSDDKSTKTYKTLKAVDNALGEQRASHRFERCAKGVCSFEGGVLHNTLFLHKITYTIANGRPYIKAIYFIAG